MSYQIPKSGANTRTIPSKRRAPAQVPDSKRPLSDRGPNPGGLPPAGIKPGWTLVHGSGAILHTHS